MPHALSPLGPVYSRLPAPDFPLTRMCPSMARQIPFPVVAAPSVTKPLAPNRVHAPIRKCEHGVYIPEGEDRAPYCQLCTPGGPANTKPVVLPRSSADPLSTAGRVQANRHGNACPECGSTIYMRIDENGSDSRRECGECGHRFKVRLSTHQRALLVEATCE